MGNVVMKKKNNNSGVTSTGPIVAGPREVGDPWGVAAAKVIRSSKPMVLEPDQIGPTMGGLMPMLQGHLLSAAINTICRLSIPDAIGSETLSVRQIAVRIQECPNLDEHKLWR
eukprot:1186192-Prorocentrum_minimum.AAC.2